MKSKRTILLAVLIGSLCCCGLASAEGQPTGVDSAAPDQVSAGSTTASPAPTAEDAWHFDASGYAWVPGVHGDVGAFGYDLGYKASASDVLSHADLGGMGQLNVRYKRIVALVDFVGAPLTVTRTKIFELPSGSLAVSAQVKYTEVILNTDFGYRLIDHEKLKIDAFTGYRFWHNGITLNVYPSPLGKQYYHSTDWTDPLVGSRILFPLSRKLVAIIRGDVGGWGAGAQLDWQLLGVLNYQIKPNWGLAVGWRYLYYDLGGSAVNSTLAQSGIVVGATYSFKAEAQ